MTDFPLKIRNKKKDFLSVWKGPSKFECQFFQQSILLKNSQIFKQEFLNWPPINIFEKSLKWNLLPFYQDLRGYYHLKEISKPIFLSSINQDTICWFNFKLQDI